MEKKKSNSSLAANTAISTDGLTTTPFSTDLSAETAQTIQELRSMFQKSNLVQELLNGLTLMSQLSGHMDDTEYRNYLSNLLHTWPDTALKKYREYQRRIITDLESLNSKVSQMGLGKTTLSRGPRTSTLRITSSSPVVGRSCLPRTTTASLKKRTRLSTKKSKKRAERRKSN